MYKRRWMYFRTDETTVDGALKKFSETLENVGINAYNMDVLKAVLRDSNDNEIDAFRYRK